MTDNSAHGFSKGSEPIKLAENMKSKIAEKIYNETPDSIKDEVRAYANKIVDEYYDSKKESDFEENALLEIDRLNEELKQRDETIKQLRDEISNHIVVNSLLTDSDGEADLANKLYNIQSELKRKDEEIAELKDIIEKKEVAFKLITGQQYEEIRTLKDDIDALKKGIQRGDELYAHLRFDDQPFTPYQLALQEISELKEALKWALNSLSSYYDDPSSETFDKYNNARNLIELNKPEI